MEHVMREADERPESAFLEPWSRFEKRPWNLAVH